MANGAGWAGLGAAGVGGGLMAGTFGQDQQASLSQLFAGAVPPNWGGASAGIGGGYMGAGLGLMQNPALGMGMNMLLPGLGTAVGGLASLGGALMPFLNMGETPEQKIARTRWERTKGPIADVFSQLFYNPTMQGKAGAYGGGVYNWQPRESTRQLYAGYLNRQYGVPEHISSAMASSALQPIKYRFGEGGPTTSAALARGGAVTPGAFAQGMMGGVNARLMEQQSRLKSAQELASYNLWKSQQLGGLIG